MWFIIGFLLGGLSLHAFNAGWLDAPLAWVLRKIGLRA
jgi:hypothetical protein